MVAKKVPVILQMEAVECGAASLAMILAYYKRYIPLEQLRMDCNVSRDGSNAKYILIAAKMHNLSAKGMKCSIEYLKECNNFPAIIYWNFNHFVVLKGFKNDRALINDPAMGAIEVDAEEFDKSFTGIALFFEPNDEFEPCGKPKNSVGFLIKHLKSSKAVMVFVTTMGFLLAVTAALKPVFYEIFVDKILIGGRDEWMTPLIIGMGISLAAAFLTETLQNIYLNKFRAKLAVKSSAGFMWHVLHLPVEFFQQRFAGDISERQQSNSEIADTVANVVIPTFLNIVMIGIYFVLLVSYNAVMALVGIASAVVSIVIMRVTAKQNENSNRNMQRDEGKLSGVMLSGVTMIETIKAGGAEFGYFERLAGYFAKYSNSQAEVTRRNLYSQLIPSVLSQLCASVILILGIYNILTGSFSVGTLMAFQGFMDMFLVPVQRLVDSMQEIQNVSGMIDCVQDVMNYSEDENLKETKSENGVYTKLKGDVELKNVTFGYSKAAPPLISNFSLKVKSGKTVALVGGSGSGKSTVAKLIAGLYSVNDGEILFDGKKRCEHDRYVMTNSVAMVDQSAVMFGDTIKNNITMWDDTVSEEVLISACKDACIHDEIINRKDGYDALVSEGGANFSGGQRQRMEIARAFVLNPSVMILDEATSALDPTTEKIIMDAIKRRGITCFVIAHRLATIRDADEIIMLEYGRQTERGTHSELMQLDGRYAMLVKSE